MAGNEGDYPFRDARAVSIGFVFDPIFLSSIFLSFLPFTNQPSRK